MIGNYFRARYYDPGTGRFLSEDPIGFESGEKNFYRYVNNSTINSNDPSGNGPIMARICIATAKMQLQSKLTSMQNEFNETISSINTQIAQINSEGQCKDKELITNELDRLNGLKQEITRYYYANVALSHSAAVGAYYYCGLLALAPGP